MKYNSYIFINFGFIKYLKVKDIYKLINIYEDILIIEINKKILFENYNLFFINLFLL